MAPRLTVVVPLYNVEEYLGACLDSLAGQTMADLEVVMIDDGSTDGGADVAREFTRRDPRFRLVQQENAGLGAARNAGAGQAHPDAEFLTFVDSDDVVPPGAFARMLAELDASGSDFATGNVLRLRANGALEQSPMFRRPMETPRRATHVTRDWILLGDRIACNKVFRRAFWDRHAFAFPSGVLYEDIAVVLPPTSWPGASTSWRSRSTTGGTATAPSPPGARWPGASGTGSRRSPPSAGSSRTGA